MVEDLPGLGYPIPVAVIWEYHMASGCDVRAGIVYNPAEEILTVEGLDSLERRVLTSWPRTNLFGEAFLDQAVDEFLEFTTWSTVALPTELVEPGKRAYAYYDGNSHNRDDMRFYGCYSPYLLIF